MTSSHARTHRYVEHHQTDKSDLLCAHVATRPERATIARAITHARNHARTHAHTHAPLNFDDLNDVAELHVDRTTVQHARTHAQVQHARDEQVSARLELRVVVERGAGRVGITANSVTATAHTTHARSVLRVRALERQQRHARRLRHRQAQLHESETALAYRALLGAHPSTHTHAVTHAFARMQSYVSAGHASLSTLNASCIECM
jgi:hypothetical protein